MVPGTLATLRELTNPERRRPYPRQEVSQEVTHTSPAVPFELDHTLFLILLQAGRWGAARGPSGMTADHPFLVCDSEGGRCLAEVAPDTAQGQIPDEALEGIKLGRVTVLRKLDGKSSCQEGGESHRSLPLRFDHESRMRVRRPHSANHHGQG